MIAIADILQAGEKLTAVAPFLAGIQNEEQYTQALELVDHLRRARAKPRAGATAD